MDTLDLSKVQSPDLFFAVLGLYVTQLVVSMAYKPLVYSYFVCPLRHLPGPKDHHFLIGQAPDQFRTGNPNEPFLSYKHFLMRISKARHLSSLLDSAIETEDGVVNYNITKFASLLGASFHKDPLYSYVLHNLSPAQRRDYLPQLLRAVVKACLLSGGIGFQIYDWSACGVVMPPGKGTHDSVLTLFRAGLVPALWKLGVSGCKRADSDMIG
ncbi:hypothetical protein B0H63DRAFT_529667 [Podospora didyma]|uniref:Uncharacterized protein n=1 Tax=Podospora didyma TaxID=330526 RepID=A0AAE0N256_9PEZI|nr:hypothetical protein B0H63DRAFT_529667 [Podospora didyma]